MSTSNQNNDILLCSSNEYSETKYPNGNVYIGNKQNDLPNGYGEMIYQDGHKYVGFWKNGKFNGKGSLTYPVNYYPNQPDIRVYEGDWEFGFLVNCTNGHVYEEYSVKVNI